MRRPGTLLVRSLLLPGLLLLPARADAFWRWLDELSGPGPFNGVEVEARLYCFADRAKTEAIQTRTKTGQERAEQLIPAASLPCFHLDASDGPRKGSINLSVSYNWAKNANLRYDDGREHRVHLIEVRPSAWVRPARSVEVGAGVSWLYFRGDRFDSFSRVALHPVMVDIKPFALLNDMRRKGPLVRRYAPDGEGDLLLTVRTGLVIVPKGFTGADFGAPNDPFEVGYEVLPSVSVRFDFDWLWRRRGNWAAARRASAAAASMPRERQGVARGAMR